MNITAKSYFSGEGGMDLSFYGTDSDTYRQIGNAAAVPMGEQIQRYFNKSKKGVSKWT